MAEVHGTRVVLGDVANLSSSNLSALQRAMVLPLGHAPRAGDSAFIERDRVERRFRTYGATGVPMQIQWAGATDTTVRSVGRAVDADEVVSMARGALMSHLAAVTRNLPQAQLELQAVSFPATGSVPDGSVLSARPLGGTAIAKRMLVWVDAWVDGRVVRTMPVRFDVEVNSVVPVAAGSLAAGTVLNAQDVVPRRVNMAAYPALAVSAVAAKPPDAGLGEGTLRRAVQSGEPVFATTLQPKPAVVRGEWANLVSRQGIVTLESRVEVLQDGRPGETVRVRQAHATGMLLARVSGPGQLEMQP